VPQPPRQVLQDETDEDVIEGCGAKGKAKMSACWNRTLVSPAASVIFLASATESRKISNLVNCAPGSVELE